MAKPTKSITIKKGPSNPFSAGDASANPSESVSTTGEAIEQQVLTEEPATRGTEDQSSVLSSEASPMDIDSNELSSVNERLSSESLNHYHFVPPMSDARGSAVNPSARIDVVEASNDYPKRPFVFEDSTRLGSDKRRYLRISNDDENTEEAKRLTAVAMNLEKAEKAFKLLFGQETTLVPAETPLFQWRGHVFNKHKPNFKSVEDCLDQFERVLFSHSMSLEDNWRRIVPARLST
ncbi:hypothetical protein MBANPS3_012253 [Mucor bainieri]